MLIVRSGGMVQAAEGLNDANVAMHNNTGDQRDSENYDMERYPAPSGLKVSYMRHSAAP